MDKNNKNNEGNREGVNTVNDENIENETTDTPDTPSLFRTSTIYRGRTLKTPEGKGTGKHSGIPAPQSAQSEEGTLKYEAEVCFGTSCSMCEERCPTYMASHRRYLTARSLNRLALGLEIGALTPDKASAAAAFSCCLCGYCSLKCDMDNLSHFEALRSRFVAAGHSPEPHLKIATTIEHTGHMYPEDRIEPVKGENDAILFVGCSNSKRPNYVKKVLKVAAALGIRLGIDEEMCCGYPLYSNGFISQFQEHRERFLLNYSPRNVVTLCPTCHISLVEKIGINAVHATQFLLWHIEKSIRAGDAKWQFTPLNREAGYHDPCHLARLLRIIDEPRSLLLYAGIKVVEMEHSGPETQCCGGGGTLQAFDSKLSMEIAKRRISEAVDSHVSELITSCPTCLSTLRKAADALRTEGKETVIVKDIFEILAESLGC
ncbi:MAG: (Fe-S)-binding protein [Thermoplasmata archaeon]